MNVRRLNRFGFVSVLIVFCALILPSLLPATARADRTWNEAGWNLDFDDEFNSNAVNTTKWNINVGPNSGNNELEYYSPNNVYETNGYLVLKSQVEATATVNDNTNVWWWFTSGKVNTYGKFAQTYGRFEINAKLPTGVGIWPAHWMLDYISWPPEIDITEIIGNDPYNLVVGHHWGPLPAGCVYPWDCNHTSNTTVYWGIDWTQAFHTYTMEWDWDVMSWYQDGVNTFSSYEGVATTDNPMYLILNTAVGGDWPGWPNSSTPWPQYHLIDWVRAYQAWDGEELPNGGFEYIEDNAFPNWDTINDTGNIIPDPVQQNALDGQNCAQMYGAFTAATNSSWLDQSQTAAPGQMFETTVWAANRPNDMLQGANNVVFQLNYFDTNWNLLAQYPLTVVTSNTPPSYTQYTIREIAPTNTSYVQVAMQFNQFNFAAGSANFDDATLTPITSQSLDSLRVLVNGDFEEGDGNDFMSWQVYGNTSNIVVEPAPINIYQGKRSVLINAQTNGLVPATGLYQDIPARPAETWMASAWAQNRVGSPVQGSNTAVMVLEFLDANDVLLQSNVVTMINQASPPGYTNATLTETSPANTAYARILLEYRQVAGGGGSVNFDEATLATSTQVGTLVNEGLQLYSGTNFPGWVIYGAGWNVVPDPLAVNTRTGTSAIQMFGQYPGNGAWNESGVYQDLDAAAGEVWQASVWAENRPNDLTQGANQGILKLEFHDSSGNLLDSDELTCVTSNSPDYYQQYFIKRLAPALTASARIVMAYDQQNDAGGSADFTAPLLAQLSSGDPLPVLNSSFENGSEFAFPNWPQYGTNYNIQQDTSTNDVHTGAAAVLMEGTYLSSYDTSGLYQDFPAQAYQMWQADVWGLNWPSDPLWPGNIANLKIEFYDTNDDLLASNVLAVITSASPTNYQWYATRQISPYGTSRARVVLELVQTNWFPGIVDFDDVNMEVLSPTNATRELLNGGFEVGQGSEFGAWVPYGSGVAQFDAITNNAHSGSECLQVYGAFNGYNNASGVYQDIPVNAGELWQASVWARSRPGDMISGSNTAPIKLEFHDYWGNYLQGDSIIAGDVTSTTNYQWYAVRDFVPSDAYYARIVLEYDQVTNASGSVDLDDAGLSLVTAQTNPQLLNGGFEYYGADSFADWTLYGSGFNILIDPVSANAHSGKNCVQMFGRFTNTVNNSDLYQTLPAVAGQVWEASVWSRNRPGDSLQGFNQAALKLEYLDQYFNELSVSEQVVDDATSTTNYQPAAVICQAPTGTAWARITLEMDQTAEAGGSVNFDDAALTQVASLNGLQAQGRVLWDGTVPLAGAVNVAGALILNPGMNMDVTINGPNPGAPGYGQITASNVTINGALNIVLPTSFNGQPYIPRAGQSFTIISAPAINGTFTTVNGPTGLGGGPAFALVYTPTSVVVDVVADLDSDNNGLPDYWEEQYFHTLTGTSPTADPDGDGMNNLQEFMAGTNPTNAASYFHVQSIAENPGGGMAVSYLSVTNRVYTLYYTDAFNSGVWSNVPSATNVAGTGGLQTLVDPATNLTHRTYKVMVQLPP